MSVNHNCIYTFVPCNQQIIHQSNMSANHYCIYTFSIQSTNTPYSKAVCPSTIIASIHSVLCQSTIITYIHSAFSQLTNHSTKQYVSQPILHVFNQPTINQQTIQQNVSVIPHRNMPSVLVNLITIQKSFLLAKHHYIYTFRFMSVNHHCICNDG